MSKKAGGRSQAGGAPDAAASAFAGWSYEELVERKVEIEARHERLTGAKNPAAILANSESIVPKRQETHFDFVMKEMAWLAVDFSKERQRHITNGKKLARAVEQYHKTKDARKVKKIKDEILALRKTAGRISRDVLKFWLKINKVIAFKQKTEADEIRQKAMDKHLVFLVKQTERYTSALTATMRAGGQEDGSVASSRATSVTTAKPTQTLASIRRAAAEARRGMGSQDGEQHMNVDGASDIDSILDSTIATEMDVEGDSEFEIDDADPAMVDDETTFIEAEAAEDATERAKEIAALQTDADMPIEQLRAMYSNMPEYGSDDEDDEEGDGENEDDEEAGNGATHSKYNGDGDQDNGEAKSGGLNAFVSRQSKFPNSLPPATSSAVSSSSRPTSAIEDSSAGDAGGDDDSEFEIDDADPAMVDDETTFIEAEAAEDATERAKEIAALQTDADMPIEQLRAMYSNMPEYGSDDEEEDEDEDEEGEENEARNDSMEYSKKSEGCNAAVEDVEDPLMHQSDGTVVEGIDLHDKDDDSDYDLEGEDPETALDDETTFIEAEAAEDATERAKEIAALQTDADMPIEQLRAMYSNMPEYGSDDEEEEEEEEENGENDDKDALGPGDVGDERNAVDARQTSTKVTDEVGADDDSEFEIDDADPAMVDDETTFIEAEAAEDATERAKEIAALQTDADMPIEQLRAMYSNMPEYGSDDEEEEEEEDEEEEAGDDKDDADHPEGEKEQNHAAARQETNGTKSVKSIPQGQSDHPHTSNNLDKYEGANDANTGADSDSEFEMNAADDEAAVDDETTFIEAEAAEDATERAKEIEALQTDADMPIEQLRAMYSNMPEYGSDDEEDEEEKGGDEGSEYLDDIDGGADEDDHDLDNTAMDVEEKSDDEVVDGGKKRKSRTDEPKSPKRKGPKKWEQGTRTSRRVQELAEKKEANEEDEEDASESVGNVLKRLEEADQAARSVQVERPFVLAKKLTLREYQHIGFSWLVSLHDRRLNGILADEMGLGKTIQTISTLAYLATYRGLWGPHLIVVPTSCIVNWESEFKRFCPVFKVLTYYGSSKARKALRTGWSKLNSFHVCITSYQLVVQDANAFRRKRWYYMILDEAHNIKNFKSQRWQTLLNFNTQRRLLLTGTPLQNNLMELWSLMHFLMPHIFRSRKEFSYWFSNPLSSMVEGNRSVNNDLISRLHTIMRPFLLRRLKKDVAKQLPGKFEHIVMCNLSKRQMFLYEEYMSRTATKSLLTGGGYLGMMNILMQLRKVCNHPDLFEPRPITSPFTVDSLEFPAAKAVNHLLTVSPLAQLSKGIMNVWGTARHGAHQSTPVSKMAFMEFEDVNLEFPDSIKGSRKLEKYALDLKDLLRARRQHAHEFNYELSTWRCTRPELHVDTQLIAAVTVTTLIKEIQTSRIDRQHEKFMPLCWKDIVPTLDQRVKAFEDIITRFVFVIPKVVGAGVVTTPIHTRDMISGQDKQAISSAMSVFYPAAIRQRIFFPDRKLVQFDSGKLQVLDKLLRRLKAEGHKCLIFTQMSKMLDILEVFLNLHAHTYVRLDGSTGIDRRQKLMDRFNADPKLFCFILSTRSGGLGINLTGADTVIFYDSDWNPAMDAQAQDRAHRIGQTREVHIYRLVSASTVEENILTKARQKKHLDFLVMTEGNFNDSSLFSTEGLQDVLGSKAVPQAGAEDRNEAVKESGEAEPSKAEFEAALAAVEDEEDIMATKAAKNEAAEEEAEFGDENEAIKEEEDEDDVSDRPESVKNGAAKKAALVGEEALVVANGGNGAVMDPQAEEKDMEAEFASWQASVGHDFKSLEMALKPVERFALRYKQDIEHFQSQFAISEEQKLASLAYESQEFDMQWDVEEIEREKEEEEYRALSEGELLAADVGTNKQLKYLQRWYTKERQKKVQERRVRSLTGGAWKLWVDSVTGVPFWYNDDTGEYSYHKPKIIEDNERYKKALEQGFSALAISILVRIFAYLYSSPERDHAKLACTHWAEAARDVSFYKRVLSVESGARDVGANKEVELAENTFISLEAAVAASHKGDVIILSPGHHWESSVSVTTSLRIMGETDDPARVIVEFAQDVCIRSTGTRPHVMITGVALQRPRKPGVSEAYLRVDGARVSMFGCTLTNDGTAGCSIACVNGGRLDLFGTTVKGGSICGVQLTDGSLHAVHSSLSDNSGPGLHIVRGNMYLEDCYLLRNGDVAINIDPTVPAESLGAEESCPRAVMNECIVALHHCDVRSNANGSLRFSENVRLVNGNAPNASMLRNSKMSSKDCLHDDEKEGNTSLSIRIPPVVVIGNTTGDKVAVEQMVPFPWDTQRGCAKRNASIYHYNEYAKQFLKAHKCLSRASSAASLSRTSSQGTMRDAIENVPIKSEPTSGNGNSETLKRPRDDAAIDVNGGTASGGLKVETSACSELLGTQLPKSSSSSSSSSSSAIDLVQQVPVPNPPLVKEEPSIDSLVIAVKKPRLNDENINLNAVETVRPLPAPLPPAGDASDVIKPVTAISSSFSSGMDIGTQRVTQSSTQSGTRTSDSEAVVTASVSSEASSVLVSAPEPGKPQMATQIHSGPEVGQLASARNPQDGSSSADNAREDNAAR